MRDAVRSLPRIDFDQQAKPSLSDWVTLLRPRQWVKNAFVLAPLLFGDRATDPEAVLAALAAMATFCVLASGVYAMNDAHDAERDRAHPTKKARPVASGRIGIPQARWVGAGLATIAAVAAALLELRFGLIAVAYLLANVAYTFKLREIVILDVFTVASFFLMRLLAGAVVVNVTPSIWLLLCGGLLALYLAFAKRRHELVVLGDGSTLHRDVLGKYDVGFLNQVSGVLLSVTLVAYVMYTLSSETAARVGSDVLGYSVVFVLFGVFRYLYLTYRKGEGGDPSETLLTDGPLIASAVLWFAYCSWVVYLSRTR